MKVAPTVVEQQQRQEDGHPLLLDAPVSHRELAQGMCKQALQSKWPETVRWVLLPSRASLTPAGRHRAGSTESLVRVTTEVPPAVSDSRNRMRYITCCFHRAVYSANREHAHPLHLLGLLPSGLFPCGGSQGFPGHKPICRCHQVTYPAGQLTEDTIY